MPSLQSLTLQKMPLPLAQRQMQTEPIGKIDEEIEIPKMSCLPRMGLKKRRVQLYNL
jgi:hypothetical protein